MRGFSKEAMEQAEIIHDYNYAQVLTLNLVRQGFRMKEVPIHYQVRVHGSRLLNFASNLVSVLPAIWREMRRPIGNGQRTVYRGQTVILPQRAKMEE